MSEKYHFSLCHILPAIYILFIATTPIFCSKEKNEHECQKIYLWRYIGWHENMNLELFECYFKVCKRSGLRSKLSLPYFYFLSDKCNVNANEEKRDLWFKRFSNYTGVLDIKIKDDIDYLDEYYKDDICRVSFNEKLLRFIQENMISSNKTKLKYAINDLFFKAINLKNVGQYYLAANLWIFSDIWKKFYLSKINDAFEFKIELIYDNNAISALFNNRKNETDKFRTDKNFYTNRHTFLKIDLDSIVNTYPIWYIYLIRFYTFGNIDKKFSKEHEKKIENHFIRFEAEYEKIVKICIEKNEKIYILLSFIHNDLNDIIKNTDNAYLDRADDEKEILFIKKH